MVDDPVLSVFFQVEDNVWHFSYSVCSIGTRNGIFSRKPSVAIPGAFPNYIDVISAFLSYG